MDDTARQPLGTAVRQMQLSARAYHRILKRSRTIANLPGVEREDLPALPQLEEDVMAKGGDESASPLCGWPR